MCIRGVWMQLVMCGTELQEKFPLRGGDLMWAKSLHSVQMLHYKYLYIHLDVC